MLDGREIAIQPRVFDVLTHLLRNHDRVVPKHELLDAVWNDIHVTENSLQRAISVARRTLKEGGLPEALRAYPRQGYRFCAPLAVVEDEPSRGSRTLNARWAYAESRFEEAAEEFAEADRKSDLPGVPLEHWGESLYAVGRGADACAPLERAVAAHSVVNDRRGAARAALLLCKIHIERKNDAVAAGWLQRATALLQGQTPSVEEGLLSWTEGRMAALRGDHASALLASRRSQELARKFDDADLEALALLDSGAWLQALQEFDEGVALHDEAAALALSGALSPRVAALVYCGVIWSCRNRADWRRAGQWSDEFTRYCDSLNIPGYPGLCTLHRAEVMHFRGELEPALDEARRACALLPTVAPWAEGEGHRIRGEIELTFGRLAAAEAAFQRAHELGWEPQPGYALLLVERGETAAAIRGLERALDASDWANQQRRALLFGHLALVSARAGEIERAEAAVQAMNECATLDETPALQSVRDEAQAAILIEIGDLEGAESASRSARERWLAVGAPLQAARVGLQRAQLLFDMGDPRGAELELRSASRVFDRAGAEAFSKRCDALAAKLVG